MELINKLINNVKFSWYDVECGTIIEVNWPQAFNPKYKKFEAPFIGVDSNGFIVLEVDDRDAVYDGFPPDVCSIK